MLKQDKTWLLIESKLNEKLAKALEGLTQINNTHEEDLRYKAQIAICKEFLKLPQTLDMFAVTNRGNE